MLLFFKPFPDPQRPRQRCTGQQHFHPALPPWQGWMAPDARAALACLHSSSPVWFTPCKQRSEVSLQSQKMHYLSLHLLYLLQREFLGQGIVYKPLHLNNKEMENTTCKSTKHKTYSPPGTHILITDEHSAVLALQRFSVISLSPSEGGNNQHLVLIYYRSMTANC